MGPVRRRVSWIVSLWLASQVAGLVAAPLAFCCRPVVQMGDDDCCQGVAPGQLCPMHHARAGAKNEPTCKMRDACGRADAGLLSLAGIVGLLPPATPAVRPFEVRDVLGASSRPAVSRTLPPDSPPPRA
jgi:hypothetical protein